MGEGKNFFTMKTVKLWNRLLREVMQSPDLTYIWSFFEQEADLDDLLRLLQPEISFDPIHLKSVYFNFLEHWY